MSDEDNWNASGSHDDNSTMTDSSDPANASQATTSRPMALITLEQRAALLEYLAKQPYQDVAGGIEFLRNALTINVNFTPPDSKAEHDDHEA